MKKITLTLVIASSLLLVSTLDAKTKKHHKENNYKKEKILAKNTIKSLTSRLKKQMKKAMKKGGPANAVEFCSSKASEIVTNFNNSLKNGVSIKRVTTNPRNEKHKANENETKILNTLQTLKDNKIVLPKMLIQNIDITHTRVIKPIMIKPVCLVCHGTSDTLDQNASKVIQEKYPNDKATDYKVGDLRGAFIIDIVKKK